MSASPRKKSNDNYGDDEARRRFEKALRAAVNTSPKPLKGIPKKRRKSRDR